MLTQRLARRTASSIPFSRHVPSSRPFLRRYATDQTSSNPTANFYKTFTRPVAKTLLIAVFAYQVAYWTWVKLETDEIRGETDATIADLEAKVEDYKNAQNPGDKTTSSTGGGKSSK